MPWLKYSMHPHELAETTSASSWCLIYNTIKVRQGGCSFTNSENVSGISCRIKVWGINEKCSLIWIKTEQESFCMQYKSQLSRCWGDTVYSVLCICTVGFVYFKLTQLRLLKGRAWWDLVLVLLEGCWKIVRMWRWGNELNSTHFWLIKFLSL